MEKRIGKIQKITFGMGGYQDAQFGVSLQFGSDKESWGVQTFVGFWAMEPSPNAQWTLQSQKDCFGEMCLEIIGWLRDAKVDHVDRLAGKPVEVTLDGGMLKTWRLLTEAI